MYEQLECFTGLRKLQRMEYDTGTVGPAWDLNRLDLDNLGYTNILEN